MSPEEIKAAVAARIDAEEVAGIPRTISDPAVLADLARIVVEAEHGHAPRRHPA